MKISKPDMSNVWAEGGSVAVVPSEKISQGWVVEIPPCEQMNFVQNRQDAGIAYMLQQGIPEWDSSTEYQAVTSYAQFDGVVYKAIGTNTNKPPTTFPDFWEVAFDAAGSAQIVQDQIDAIEADPDPFDQYLLKTRATANGIDAELAVTSNLMSTNLNIVDAVGEYYIDITCTNKPFSAGVMKVWVESAGHATYQLVQSFNGQGVATRFRSNAGVWTNWAYSVTSSTPKDISTLQDQITALSDALTLLAEASKIKIGQLFLTSVDFLAPSEVTAHLGYGSWVRYAEGRSIVGKSVQPPHPVWTKTLNDDFGEYDHTLSIAEMPAHVHPNSGRSAPNTRAWSNSSSDYTPDGGDSGSTGGGQSHNNVQPSTVTSIWRRTA